MQESLTVEVYLSIIRDKSYLKNSRSPLSVGRLSQLSPLKKETFLILFFCRQTG